MSTQLGTIDAGGDGKDVLLAVINNIYGKEFTLDDFDFGTPQFVVTPNPSHNSFIKLGPKAATGYYGFRTIYYNRIHVSELGPIKVPYADEQFLTQVLPKINTKYGILIKPSDVYEEIITPPVLPAKDVVLSLQFRPDSLVFYGGDMIILGNNDPSIEFDSPINLPFANETVLFVNSTYPVAGNLYAEYSSVALATDYVRQKSARIYNPADDIFTRGSKAKFTNMQYAKLQDVLPFVFTWPVMDGKAIRGLTIYGDVLQLDAAGDSWSTISNVLGLTGSVPEATITALKNKPVFKKGVQSSNGDLFIIKRDDTDNSVKILTSTDSGETWSDITITPGNEHFTRYSLWDFTEIKDMVSVGTKLYMIVWSNDPYSGSLSGDILPPAIEIFNIYTGETEFHPIGDKDILGMSYGVELNGGLIKFVNSNNNDGLPLDVVALFTTAVTKRPIALYYRYELNTYTGMIISNVDLEPEALTNGYYDIAGYKQKLVKSDNYLLAVEIIGRVDRPDIDFELYMNTHERTETGFFNHGVTVLSTVVGAAGISHWTNTSVDLGYGTTPKFLTVDHKGLRTNYIFQGEVGLFKTKYHENVNGDMVPTLEHIFKSGAQTGYNIHSAIAGGQYRPIKLMEYVTKANKLTPMVNIEEEKDLISYSFITKNDLGKHDWLVSTAVNAPLVSRKFDPLYGHVGKRPLAVASMEGKIFVWSEDGKSIHYSEVGGKQWSPYAATLAYYVDSSEKYEGTANLTMKREFFKSASLKNNKLIFEIAYTGNLQVINPVNRELNEVITVSDNLLYEIDNSPTFDQDAQFNSIYSARGLNVLSSYSPRKLIAWDSDTDNNVLAIAKYTENRDTPLEKSVNLEYIHEDILLDPLFEVTQLEYDLVYLGLKHIAVTKSEDNFYKLYVVKADDTVVVTDLSDPLEDLHNFEPRAKTHIWDATDDDDAYTPFVLIGRKDVALFERVDVDGNYSVTRHVLTIPTDNGAPLELIPMFNDNRKDLLVYQKGNGIFRFGYAWDNIERVSTITLVKIFSLATLADVDFISGCSVDSTPVEPYGEVRVPVIPAYGTVLDTICQGTSKVEVRADGRLGSYKVVVETNSVDCGYIPPVPGNVEDGGGNINVGP